MFQNVKTYETGLSDFHKLVVSTMKLSYKKRLPRMIKYRDYKYFSNEHFKNSLYEKRTNNTELDYNGFENIVLNLLSSQAPFKKRMVRANQRVFMNKEIRKAIMVRSRLRNKFLKERTTFSREAYNKQRNYCVKLIRESKIKYFGNLNVKDITDNEKFWKAVGSNFSSKKPINENISLWEKNRLVTDEKSIAKVFNDYFTSIIKHLHIEMKEFDSKNVKLSNNAALSAVNKFQNHQVFCKLNQTELSQALVFDL